MKRHISSISLAALVIALGTASASAQTTARIQAPIMPTLPIMPPMPIMQTVPDLSALSRLSDLSDLADLSRLAELSRIDRDGNEAREQTDRAQDAAERARDRAERDRDRVDRQRDEEGQNYDAGQSELDNSHWDRAIQRFDRVIDMKGSKADASLYWKAYAQNRLGQRADSLSTIAQLTKDYPKSRYLEQAKALEVDVRRDTGSPVQPQNESDDDLKLMALNALQNSAPDEAIPMLQKVLQGTGSPRLKERALFVLAQSHSPKARDVLVGIAKGNGLPDLQNKAIQYLGLFGGSDSRAALGEIYSATSDVDVKKRILRAFMVAGERDQLLHAAQTEQNPDLRGEAVQQLGVMGAHEQLWTLYQKETNVDVKKQIIRAMFVGGDASRLMDLAKSEQNPDLRMMAIKNLGLMRRQDTGDALVGIYTSDKNAGVRGAVITALFLQNNADALVAIARKEQDPEMKKQLVQRLSLMHSKAATDYMVEILNGGK
jgi:tetratricopeptide (TPR) repeat protein